MATVTPPPPPSRFEGGGKGELQRQRRRRLPHALEGTAEGDGGNDRDGGNGNGGDGNGGRERTGRQHTLPPRERLLGLEERPKPRRDGPAPTRQPARPP